MSTRIKFILVLSIYAVFAAVFNHFFGILYSWTSYTTTDHDSLLSVSNFSGTFIFILKLLIPAILQFLMLYILYKREYPQYIKSLRIIYLSAFVLILGFRIFGHVFQSKPVMFISGQLCYAFGSLMFFILMLSYPAIRKLMN